MKYLKSISLLLVFLLTQSISVAQNTIDVTFRYYSNDDAVRAFVPGEFNNWGNNSSGRISTTDGSLMQEDQANGFWYKTISLTVGGGTSTYEGQSGYAYKFHEQYNASGSEWQWFTDPLNDIAIGNNNDSFIEVTTPLIFQLQPSNNQIVGEEDEIWATVASTDSDPIDLNASEFIVNGNSVSSFAGNYDTDRQLFSITDLSTASLTVGENTIKLVAVTESGATRTDSVTFAYLPDVSPEKADRPQGLQDGISYSQDGTSATLSLFAPGKDYVFVLGNFNEWKVNEDFLMKKDSLNPDSVWHWIEITGLTPGEEYGMQYLVDGELRISDPYSELVLDPFNDQYIPESTFPNLLAYPSDKTQGWVTVLQPGRDEYQWEATDYQRPKKTELVIYELLVRDFLSTKNFQTLTDTLDYLENLGVNAIELMPVSEFDGNLSWGYNPNHHLALDKFYGTPTAFKKFVDEAHKRDMAVILDVVMNHATGANPLYQLYGNDDEYYFNSQPRHASNVFNDFDHSYSATQYYTKRMIEHWINEYKIDGFRWDLTKGFTQNCTESNGSCTSAYQQDRVDLLKKYADYQWAADPDFIVIFEHLGTENEEKEWANYRVHEGKGVMLWGNMNFAYGEASMGYNENGKSNLFGVLSESRSTFQQRHLVGYMESHDEQWLMLKKKKFGNSSGNYDIKDLGTALARQKLVGAFFFPMPGPKMMWQFGELGYGWGEDECLKPGGGSNGDCLASDPGRVSEKPIRWNYYDDNERLKVYKTWSSLINLRKSSPVFTNPDASSYKLSEAIKIYVLQHEDSDALVVGNFGVTEADAEVTFPASGEWYNFFEGTSITVGDPNMTFTLTPGEFRIYTTSQFETPEEGLLTSAETASGNDLPDSFRLKQNYPNPFNPTTTIAFDVAKTGVVKLEVFDVLGRKVTELVNGRKAAGSYSVSFNADNLGSGMYIYRLQAGDEVFTQKMMLVK
ncbi:MAG: T9SS type A sorting domain-containing protein [Gracilimonas sp.]|uniref:alpha-amylase family glycosyl hydrolase n=1 Tax=Gracilimonas TaxID=649462 RepID=UPI001B04260A|nr:alpha-amylase family glycosyl hydrolase [Gracilimonas sp.]MBO6586606.1 T9SS type A sorting domain-containing protein [Gracilimonas sp.]MBO6615263.1 T9SS type A sorting domain-containing protein [Gracilimonas sp.]